MSSYEVLTNNNGVKEILNTPMKPFFPKRELLSLVIFVGGVVLLALIWPQLWMMVAIMIPVWLAIALGMVIFPIAWIVAVTKNRGKGPTKIIVNENNLKVEASGKELLNVNLDKISSIRTGNTSEKSDVEYSAYHKIFGLHRLHEQMYFLEVRFGGKTQIIAWGLNEPSADGILHEIGFTERM